MANLTSLIQMLLVLLLSYATSVSCQCRTIATTPTFPDLFPNPLVLTSDTGMITSPNFPSNYNANEQCAWEIRGADDSNIMVTFEAFNTGTTSQLGFLTGESAFGGDAIVFPTGSTLPPVVNITDNVLGIAWATGAGATATGWKIRYQIFQSTSVTSALILDSNATTTLLALLATFGALILYGLIGLTS